MLKMFKSLTPLNEPQSIKFDFRKKHHFCYNRDVPMLKENKIAEDHNSNFPNVKYESKLGSAALQLQIPDWIAFKNQILKFGAVCRDSYHPFIQEPAKFHDILYFLEDDTIQVVETTYNKNDSRFRGTVLKRHKILKQDNNYYTLDDFNINKEVTFYGRRYTIYKCDKYTRDYLINLGIQVPPDNEEIAVASEESKLLKRPTTCPPQEYQRDYPFKKFLEYDGNVLQFYCLWIQKDDEVNMFTHVLLLYYLADDTIELRNDDVEKELSSQGRKRQHARDGVLKSKILVRRSKLPKKKSIEPLPGLKLNQDDLRENSRQDYYQDKDLKIGSTINAWGRSLLIYDCNEFTKQFLKIKYGVEVQAMKLEDAFPEITHQKFDIYQEDDSKPDDIQPSFPPYHSPIGRRDFVKFMTRDKTGSESHILRFLATLCGINNENRQFVISYHLVDDTISIFEKPQRNSGYRGGKFMECCRVQKWKDPNNYVNASDLYIGAKICINGHWFNIIDADEYTLNYMENHPYEFPSSNKLEIINKLKNITENKMKDLKRLLSEKDPGGSGKIAEPAFRLALRQICSENSLNEHEILVLKREYKAKDQIGKTNDLPNLKSFSQTKSLSPIFLLQNQLKKEHFGDFKGLLQYFEKRDVPKIGFLKEDKALRSCIAYPLPASKYLIKQALQMFITNADEVNYQNFVRSIDWKLNPSLTIYNEDVYNDRVDKINYKQLLQDIE